MIRPLAMSIILVPAIAFIISPAEATSAYCRVHIQGAPVMDPDGSSRDHVVDTTLPRCLAGDSVEGVYVYPELGVPKAVEYSADALAIADLRTGELKVRALTESPHVYSSAQVQLEEGITIVAPGATASTPVPITFAFDVEGYVNPGLIVDNVWQRWEGLASFSAYIGPNYGTDYSLGLQFKGDGTMLTSAYGDWRFGDGGAVLNTMGEYVPNYVNLPETFYLTFWQQIETTSFTVRLNAAALNNADFGNTIGMRLVLPEGATFTSDSGVFLTQAPTAAVPEPASWAMMIAGFGFVGGALRRSPRGLSRLAA